MFLRRIQPEPTEPVKEKPLPDSMKGEQAQIKVYSQAHKMTGEMLGIKVSFLIHMLDPFTQGKDLRTLEPLQDLWQKICQ